MKKIKLKWLVFSIILLIFILTYCTIQVDKHQNKNDFHWYYKNIELVQDKTLGKNIYKIYKSTEISNYNLNYHQAISKKINNLRTKSTEDYLIIYNPYSTNDLSFNIYFKKDLAIKNISYQITAKNTKKFEQNLAVNKTNSYQIIGLIPNTLNKITIKLLMNNQEKKITFNLDLTNIEILSSTKLKTISNQSKKELSEGLYLLQISDNDNLNYLSLYDNNGVIRGYTLVDTKTKVIFNNNSIYYMLTKNKLAKMNNLGEITEIYQTGKYQIMAFDFDKNGNILLVASKNQQLYLIRIDINTRKISNLLNLTDLLGPNFKIDSFILQDDFLLLNDTNTIIKIINISTTPEITYLISKDKIKDFQETYYLNKATDFELYDNIISPNYKKSTTPNEYFLIFLNSSNLTKFPTSEKSSLQTYLVNEERKTYTLKDEVLLDYNASAVKILSSTNYLIANNKSSFIEFDTDYTSLMKFILPNQNTTINDISKYTFNNFYFN